VAELTRQVPSQVIADALRKEGVSVLLKGWVPAWWRMFPTTTLTFMFLEQLKRIYAVKPVQ
jgi:dicarboxylate transporter 10